jgi:hypothetical protein
MPPPAVKTIRELIYWEYGKLAAEVAVGNRRNYAYVMSSYERFKKLDYHPLQIMRQYGLLVRGEGQCAYCGGTEDLSETEIIPVSKGGPDHSDNRAQICAKCKIEKGDRDLFEWYGKDRRYEIPRIVLGKYLKLAFEVHQERGTLDMKDINRDGKLDVFDLGAIFKVRHRQG